MLLLWILVYLSAVFVYFDAISKGIFKIKGERALWNLSPTGWFYCVLLFWIIGFPLYLTHRKKIAEKCKQTSGNTTSLVVALMNAFVVAPLVLGLLGVLASM